MILKICGCFAVKVGSFIEKHSQVNKYGLIVSNIWFLYLSGITIRYPVSLCRAK